jgi:hypothetical protein
LQNEVLKRELIDSGKAATATLKRALRAVERSDAKIETAAAASLAAQQLIRSRWQPSNRI